MSSLHRINKSESLGEDYKFGAWWEFDHILGDLLVFVECHQVWFIVAKDARLIRRLSKSFNRNFAVYSEAGPDQ